MHSLFSAVPVPAAAARFTVCVLLPDLPGPPLGFLPASLFSASFAVHVGDGGVGGGVGVIVSHGAPPLGSKGNSVPRKREEKKEKEKKRKKTF